MLTTSVAGLTLIVVAALACGVVIGRMMGYVEGWNDLAKTLDQKGPADSPFRGRHD